MESQDLKNAVSGILVVDKPVGLTSHDVVEIIRKGTNIRRAGHTGTLDPRASGVLVVLVGPAVRLSEFVSASDKRYQAIIRLGGTTDTYDADGRFTGQSNTPISVTEAQFNEVLQHYVGEIEQTPPAYSAVKVQGRKAYELARQGEEVELAPRKINVYHLEVLEWAPPEVVIDVHCSSGTYVRSLANDLGSELGCGAYLVGLRRTTSGRFSLREATPLRKLQDTVIVLCADHSTPCTIKDHSADPVPVVIWGEGVRIDGVVRFDETTCAQGGLNRIPGSSLLPIALDLINRSRKYGA